MARIFMRRAISPLWLCLLLAFHSQAQEKPPAKQTAQAQLDAAGPGPEHAVMAKFAGKWDAEISMGSPGSPQSMVFKGSAETEMAVGGRFLRIQFQGARDGMKTEGEYTLGFDRRHKEYVFVAMDSWGTYFVTAKGKAPEAGQMIKMHGIDDDPQMKSMGLTKEFVFAVDLSNEKNLVVKIFFIDTRTPARKEIEYMRFNFTRKE